MKTVEIKTRPRDGFDAAELIATLRSPGFARIQQRMLEARAALVDELIATQTWDTACRLQGSIRTLDSALTIPQILRREDHDAQKRNER